MKSRKIGVLVMSYGTPASLDDIETYYTHIRRGRPPSKEQLDELTKRYEAIVGGFFPLRKNTDKQVEALSKVLEAEDIEFVCYQGLKHAKPYIEDGVEQMAQDGIREAIGIVLAPHYSVMSVGSYIQRAKEKAEQLQVNMQFVESYHLHPKLLEALSVRVAAALQQFNDVPADQIKVLFSAHSLPERILQMKDPYPQQLLETSEAIAKRTGVSNWQFVWQSAGATAEPWLGPDILEVIQSIHEQGEFKHILSCPIGFVSDHLEVLYDIDIECQTLAKSLGLQLVRTESLNVDPLFIETLADMILQKVHARDSAN